MWVLVGSIFVFALGVLTPLVIGAHVKPPILRGLELTLPVVTTAPYLLGLFYLISVVARLKQP